MIFLEYAVPMPGSASSSAWVAVLRSTRAGLAAGLASAAGLVAAGLSVAFWAWPRLGSKSSAAAWASRPTRRVKAWPRRWVVRMRSLRSQVGQTSTTAATAMKSSCGEASESKSLPAARRSGERLDRLDDVGGVALDADLGP